MSACGTLGRKSTRTARRMGTGWIVFNCLALRVSVCDWVGMYKSEPFQLTFHICDLSLSSASFARNTRNASLFFRRPRKTAFTRMEPSLLPKPAMPSGVRDHFTVHYCCMFNSTDGGVHLASEQQSWGRNGKGTAFKKRRRDVVKDAGHLHVRSRRSLKYVDTGCG